MIYSILFKQFPCVTSVQDKKNQLLGKSEEWISNSSVAAVIVVVFLYKAWTYARFQDSEMNEMGPANVHHVSFSPGIYLWYFVSILTDILLSYMCG